MRVTIIGTGYVGLTTGVVFAYLGHEVTCIDNNLEKVTRLKQGILPIYEPGLQELLAISKQNLVFSSSYQSIAQADAIFIAVGTPSKPDGNPDLTYVRDVALQVGKNLGNHLTVVINKSTVPIGSGNWVESLIADSYKEAKGCKLEGKVIVASNPEFLREGSALNDTLYPDRIVLGADQEEAINILTQLYQPIIRQSFQPPVFLPRPDGFTKVPVITTGLASAELIKYSANAFLSLKISFINEIACVAEKVGADITEISKGIGLDKRIGQNFLNAGIGWGGSCFGKDTAALLATAQDYGVEMPITDASRRINYYLRDKVIETLLEHLKILKGKTIGILGIAFKPDTDDLRDAPSLDIAAKLIRRGAKVIAHDPVAMERAKQEWADLPIQFVNHPEEVFEEADAVLLITEWKEYYVLNWKEVINRMRNPLLFDGRNALDKNFLTQIGFKYVSIGR